MLQRIFSKQNRALLAELVRTDFKLRYQGSVLGYAWSLLRPIFLFAILYVVFVYFLKTGAGIPHYAVYLLLGVIIWNFFSEMTNQSLRSIVDRGSLIRKIKIPNWIIILSSSISALISLVLNLIVLLALVIFNKVQLHITVALLPIILLEVYIFALGVSLFLSAAYVKFRDLNYIWEVVMQAGFYLTPIVYPLTKIPSALLRKLFLLNPMSQAIQDARFATVHIATVNHVATTMSGIYRSDWYECIPLGFVLLVFLGGLLYFRKHSRFFAEDI